MAENYNLIFGSNASQSYTWSDVDYQKGWETVGDTPPLGEQFDALQRRADNKAKDLNDRLMPIEGNNTNIFRQPSTAYALKDIRFYPELPAGWYFECKVAGTTDAGDITMPSPIIENATVTDGTVVWTIRKIGSGGGEAVGVIKAFAGNGDIPSGYLLCDGSAVSRTMFPDLFSVIGTTYGAGDGSTTFNLPDYNTAQRFAQGSTVAGVEKDAGLPNIEGSIEKTQTGSGTTPVIPMANSQSSVTGAFGTTYATYGQPASLTGTANLVNKVSFDASRSNPIYGASDTVQPNALTTRYIIKAFDGQTANSALIDITQYAQELAGKADRQLSNLDTANLACHVVVDSYYDSTTGDWYRVYDDGWVEQGGATTATSTYGSTTVNFLKPFASSKYSVSVARQNMNDSVYTSTNNITSRDSAVNFGAVSSKTTTSCAVASFGAQTWMAVGMGAST